MLARTGSSYGGERALWELEDIHGPFPKKNEKVFLSDKHKNLKDKQIQGGCLTRED